MVIAREMTKLFASIHVCDVADAASWMSADPIASGVNSC